MNRLHVICIDICSVNEERQTIIIYARFKRRFNERQENLFVKIENAYLALPPSSLLWLLVCRR